MTLLTNSFEGGTSGTTITAGNSGGTSGSAFDSVSIGASATAAFDNAHAANGTLSGKITTPVSATSSYLAWTTSMGSQATVWFRLSLYYTANPANTHRVWTAVQTATNCGSLQVTSAGKLQFIDASSSAIFTSTATIPLNAWFRVEGYLTGSATVGQVELKLFTTTSAVTPAETDTSAATQNTFGAPNGYRYGVSGSTASVTLWMDDIGLSSTGYIGPVPAVTSTWLGANSRDPLAYAADAPPMSPLAVPVANTAGQWLFAVASWRQDAGTAGVLQYPSTVNISDDAHNFWIPLQPGRHGTGIVRCAVWMAPAARAAQYVFASPSSTSAGSAYQAALTVLIVEIAGMCPWYQITATAASYANQGTSVTLSQSPAAGLFSLGVMAYDNFSAVVTATAVGWTPSQVVGTNNGTDDSGDLVQLTYVATSSDTLTISGSSGTTMDWAEVMICVQGAANAIAFPYAMPGVQNWPVLITEMAAGPVLNANPVMLDGTANWTGTNCSLAAVTWPVFRPWPSYQNLITTSVSVTPSGSATGATMSSEFDPVVTFLRYSGLAYVWSVAGWPSCYVQIDWYTSGLSYISTSNGTVTNVPAGAWTQLGFANGVYPPPGAAWGSLLVTEYAASGNVPASAVLYAGYAAFGAADSYENVPADDIAWSDLSSRNFTQDDIKVSRGIQYEQQSLEAGTMTVTLSSYDGAMMFGNLLSAYWPNMGDTDVPVRLRAVWPQSVTPYSVLFSGFTDHIDFEWSEQDGTLWGYATIEASDAWSRLTSQMLAGAEQEMLLDGPAGFWPCSQSGVNLAPGAIYPVTTATGPIGASPTSALATAAFTSSAISLAGAQGLSCWQSQGTYTGVSVVPGGWGVALTYFPAVPGAMPPLAGGVTVEFWMSPVDGSAGQPAATLVVCACWARNRLMWTITIDNNGDAEQGTAFITVYDKVTGTGTATQIDPGPDFLLNAAAAAEAYFWSVTFTQSTLTVTVNAVAGYVLTVSCNLDPQAAGLSWGGLAGPVYGTVTSGGVPGFGFMNLAVAFPAVYAGLLAPARQAAHYQAGFTANAEESDYWRLARILGYAGATPVVLGERCLELAAAPAAGVDSVTGATDTNSQVASAYFTNVASSTLAAMFTDGPGTLIYRRRLEWYDRAGPQWVLGELAAYPLNSNTLGLGGGTSPWIAEQNATLTSGSLPNGGAAGPYFRSCAVFHGDGATSSPQIAYGNLLGFDGVPVTPGDYYTVSALIYSPQGWAAGATIAVQYWTAAFSPAGTRTSVPVPLAAGSMAFLQVPAFQAPATAAWAFIVIAAQDTPASSVQFCVSGVVFTQAGTVTAGGAGATALEVPYTGTPKLSSDRALLYNQAQLTQYGTNLVSRFSGTDVLFTPSSGVIVVITNQASVSQRAGVPYTATLYLDNTAQALPYYLNAPSMEDFGNWITQTLAAPLLRPETTAITPAATPQAMVMGLQAEVGDTVTFRRRPQWGGAPETWVLTYLSKLTHDINQETGKWDTAYELSPFQAGSVLVCDDVIHGTLTGGNLLGW